VAKEFKDAAHDGPNVVDKTFDDGELVDPRQYGYGFWFRFLTDYPKRLVSGKIAPWYFLARMTKNVPH